MNHTWAAAIVGTLAGCGVRHATLTPGSRSAPLAIALAERLPTVVLTDERSAAYHALAIGKTTDLPAIVACTSGTAVANLHPAAIEAHQSDAPLLMLTADRPPIWRGTGANQVIDSDLFGSCLRARFDLPLPTADPATLDELQRVARAAFEAATDGPVHINVPFEEPLHRTSATTAPHAVSPAPTADGPARRRVPPDVPRLTGDGLIVVGPRHAQDGLAATLKELVGATGAVVMADALSGCRDETTLGAYDLYADLLPRPDYVVRFGGAPVSKTLNEVLAAWGGPQIVVHGKQRRDPSRSGTLFIEGDDKDVALALASAAREGASWTDVSTYEERAKEAIAAAGPDWEGTVAVATAEAARRDAAPLFVGPSLPIRDIDRYVTCPGRILANRGASGMDGSVAAVAGTARAAGRAYGLLGDLTFQHDLNGLQALRDVDARLVVIDNGGGRIFSHLPIASDPLFDKLFLADSRVDLPAVTRAFGVPAHLDAKQPPRGVTFRRGLAGNEVRATVRAAARGHPS